MVDDAFHAIVVIIEVHLFWRDGEVISKV